MSSYIFNKTLIIGVGLIGSSIARSIKNKKLSKKIIGYDNNKNVVQKCRSLKIVDLMVNKLEDIKDVDLVILCCPLGSYGKILSKIVPLIKTKCVITDVGSTKIHAIQEFNKFKNNNLIEFVPGHPIAGLEKSGPEHGFADLFNNRYCILTPKTGKTPGVKRISKMWKNLGMTVQIMSGERHDRVLAMTSHIPQLIAYSIVATANDLEKNMREEIIRYSAAGFRDFTRLAGSDPIMWRDIYLLNKNSVLDMLGRFTEDLSSLQKAIRNSDKKKLEKTFRSTRQIRKLIETKGQAGTFDPREKKKIK